ncbi:uncharacterized protein HaLaN_06388 [Haematococcus lacustris]|uniref:Guanylate cyclase domain-containing protein n=1 Tax=Haematococcus lacustris TaxID=44745 RepID=A0A699YVW1_HAELA|nr:uncharacterized protein HaLaN_06388 [Haematococcus lacustris]
MQLPVEELRAAGISVVHMGQHLVALGEGKGDTALELYCACLNTPDHAHRLWAMGPLRTLRQLQPGVLHAPVRAAAVAFMSVVGLPQLKAWSAELAELPAGYWVSSAEEEGMVLAAFPCSLQCLHWALLTLTTCMDMDWPQALLDSASGEEVVGVDAGEVACDLTPANGRFNYRGRCLNRAARINGLAVSGQGQPLCLPGLLPPLVARPLGKRELRGIPGQVALLQVALAPHTSRAQLEAADWLGLSAPGLQLSRPQQQADT